MEAFLPRIALIVVTIVLGIMFLSDIADPQKSNQNTLSSTFQSNLTDMTTSINNKKPTP